MTLDVYCVQHGSTYNTSRSIATVSCRQRSVCLFMSVGPLRRRLNENNGFVRRRPLSTIPRCRTLAGQPTCPPISEARLRTTSRRTRECVTDRWDGSSQSSWKPLSVADDKGPVQWSVQRRGRCGVLRRLPHSTLHYNRCCRGWRPIRIPRSAGISNWSVRCMAVQPITPVGRLALAGSHLPLLSHSRQGIRYPMQQRRMATKEPPVRRKEERPELAPMYATRTRLGRGPLEDRTTDETGVACAWGPPEPRHRPTQGRRTMTADYRRAPVERCRELPRHARADISPSPRTRRRAAALHGATKKSRVCDPAPLGSAQSSLRGGRHVGGGNFAERAQPETCWFVCRADGHCDGAVRPMAVSSWSGDTRRGIPDRAGPGRAGPGRWCRVPQIVERSHSTGFGTGAE